MRKVILIFSILLSLNATVFAGKSDYSLTITDNSGSRSSSITFILRNDSIIVTALTDFGRTKVDYFKDVLDKNQVKSIRKVIRGWAVKEDENFYNEANLDRYGEGFAPREIKMNCSYKKELSELKVFNCYYKELVELFHVLNTLLPEEIIVDYHSKQFNTVC